VGRLPRLRAIIGGDLSRTRSDRTLGYTMYTEPQVGRVGITADAAQEEGRPYRVVTIPLSDVAPAPSGTWRRVLRLVVDPRRTRSSRDLCGYEAGMIHVILAHMEAAQPGASSERSVHIHPTFAEGIPSLAAALAVSAAELGAALARGREGDPFPSSGRMRWAAEP